MSGDPFYHSSTTACQILEHVVTSNCGLICALNYRSLPLSHLYSKLSLCAVNEPNVLSEFYSGLFMTVSN
jgi:hypothetical protein